MHSEDYSPSIDPALLISATILFIPFDCNFFLFELNELLLKRNFVPAERGHT